MTKLIQFLNDTDTFYMDNGERTIVGGISHDNCYQRCQSLHGISDKKVESVRSINNRN